MVYWVLRIGETLGVTLPFRADSLLGLVHTAPRVSNGEFLTGLGITLHALSGERADEW